MKLTIFFDYTCGHSFALKELLRVVSPHQKLSINWRTLSLKEIRRHDTDPSAFDSEIDSFSIYALALSHAARKADFETFHNSLFDAVHLEDHDLTRDDLIAFGRKAAVDTDEFEKNVKSWKNKVKKEHTFAVEQLNAFGTPTVLFPNETAWYFRFNPHGLHETDPLEVWAEMQRMAEQPAVIEAKRSV